jgi:hypothetical protein
MTSSCSGQRSSSSTACGGSGCPGGALLETWCPGLLMSTSRILVFFSSSMYRSSTHRSSQFLPQDFNRMAMQGDESCAYNLTRSPHQLNLTNEIVFSLMFIARRVNLECTTRPACPSPTTSCRRPPAWANSSPCLAGRAERARQDGTVQNAHHRFCMVHHLRDRIYDNANISTSYTTLQPQ